MTTSHSDLFSGWYDNQLTGYREYWDNGVRGRHAHKSAIAPHAHHHVMRLPWEHYPDLPANAAKEAA